MRRHIRCLALLLLALAACRQNTPQPTPPNVPVQSNALKILIEEDGIYRIPQADLQNAGFNADLTTTDLTFTQAGQPITYHIQDNHFIFYGQAPNNRYLSNRPYLLTIATNQPTPPMDSRTLSPVTDTTLTTLSHTIRFENNQLYKSEAHNPTNNLVPWFWDVIQVQSQLEVNIDLPPQSDGSGTITVQLWGATTIHDIETDHDINVLINGQTIGTLYGDGETVFTNTLNIPVNTLKMGTNTITFDNTPEGAAFLDITYLDWFDITYQAPTQANNDIIAGISPTSGHLSLAHPSLILNITDPLRPLILNTDPSAPFPIDANTNLIAVNEDGFRSPAGIFPLRQSDWRNTNHQADMIILTTDTLAPMLTPLVTARNEQGLHTVVVPVGEIYDEFGDGQESPESLQTFIRYAGHNWTPPAPRYLFLVGDASYDYQNYLGQNPSNIVPPLMVSVQFSGETTSDSRLADIDNDHIPDLAVGRWSVDTPDQVTALVNRTLAYEQSTAPTHALFAADDSEPQFARFSDDLITNVQISDDNATRLYGATASQVTDAWNEGAWLVTYTGHGSLRLWGKEEIFTLDAIANLDSATAPIVLQFTCLTGFFVDPQTPSLSETMLTHPQGPVLLIGATSLTLPNHQSLFAQPLMTALQDPAITRMGDALLYAQHALDVDDPSQLEISDTFVLFGDPATRLIRP